MRIVLFCHSLISCWNHGNAHFLRGVATELQARGHGLRVYEPCGSWSLSHLRAEEHGARALQRFDEVYPTLRPASRFYQAGDDVASMVEGADDDGVQRRQLGGNEQDGAGERDSREQPVKRREIPRSQQQPFAIVRRRSAGRCVHQRAPWSNPSHDGDLEHIARRTEELSDVRAGPRGPFLLLRPE